MIFGITMLQGATGYIYPTPCTHKILRQIWRCLAEHFTTPPCPETGLSQTTLGQLRMNAEAWQITWAVWFFPLQPNAKLLWKGGFEWRSILPSKWRYSEVSCKSKFAWIRKQKEDYILHICVCMWYIYSIYRCVVKSYTTVMHLTGIGRSASSNEPGISKAHAKLQLPQHG